MKKILFIYLIITGLILNVRADDDNPPSTYGSISGIVIDAVTNEPLPYVNVVVRNSSDSLITGGITDDKGTFVIKAIPEGNNKVEFQFIGYEKITTELNVSPTKSKHDLSTITLSESSQQLEEVVVRGELSSVTQKIDRRVINVGKDLTATGTNASELLNNVQSVSVDSQTGGISLRGNSNVKILVDGRPTNVSAAQLLKQIPSTSIKSIELITNPSAKYNPEGMSGIINIVLYKNARMGFNGSVNSGLTVGKNVRYNGAVDFNYKTGKVNFFGNYGGNTGKKHSFGQVVRDDNASVSDFLTDYYNTSHLVKVGADLFINEKNTLSAYTIQNFFSEDKIESTRIYFESILDIDNASDSDKANQSGTYNLNYKHDFNKKGHNIEMEASYSTFNHDETAAYDQLMNPGDVTSNYLEDLNNNVHNNIVNVDYTNPITDNAKIELGLESRMRRTNNQFQSTQHQFLYDDQFSKIPDGSGGFETTPMDDNAFQYDRNIYSAYTNYMQKLGKVSMQLGARFEQYEIDAAFNDGDELGTYSDNIFSIYPSLFLTYNPTEMNQFQASYSRRVDRPSANQVNPNRQWSTPLITSVGNPELQPQFTDSYELNYTRRLKKGSISFGTFYRQVHDNIFRILNVDPLDENKAELSFANGDIDNRYGIELSSSYRPAKWWMANASFDLYTKKATGIAGGQEIEVIDNSLNLRLNNTFKVGDKLSLQLFGMYRGASENLQFIREPMYMINAGASLSVLKKKGTLSLRVNDIFNTMGFNFESTNFFPSHGGFKWESRTAYVGFMYNFGRGDNKARRRRARDSNESSGGGGF